MNKKLIIGKDNIIFGVCSGFAEYFDMDPTIMRIIWFFMTLLILHGIGIIAYILCALIMPEN